MYQFSFDRTTKQAVILRDGVEIERTTLDKAARRLTELRQGVVETTGTVRRTRKSRKQSHNG